MYEKKGVDSKRISTFFHKQDDWEFENRGCLILGCCSQAVEQLIIHFRRHHTETDVLIAEVWKGGTVADHHLFADRGVEQHF